MRHFLWSALRSRLALISEIKCQADNVNNLKCPACASVCVCDRVRVRVRVRMPVLVCLCVCTNVCVSCGHHITNECTRQVMALISVFRFR